MCYNGASCTAFCDDLGTLMSPPQPRYTCACTEGFEGRNCSLLSSRTPNYLAFITIVLIVFIFVLAIVLLWWCFRCRSRSRSKVVQKETEELRGVDEGVERTTGETGGTSISVSPPFNSSQLNPGSNSMSFYSYVKTNYPTEESPM